MFDVSKSDRYFFDEYAILVVGRAKLMFFVLLDKGAGDEVGVVLSKLKDVLIVVVCILISWKFIVFFDVEFGVHAVSPNCVGYVFLDELPLFFDEIVMVGFVAHKLPNLIIIRPINKSYMPHRQKLG